MGIFNLDSPFMQTLSKIADLMILNVITLLFCIPVVTAGAALTAMNYVTLKMARNEECYIFRSFLKSFKENFKQATIIWLMLLATVVVLIGDYIIMAAMGSGFPLLVRSVVTLVGLMVISTSMFLFPVQAKFSNPVLRTIRNSFFMSVLQLPKTVLMVVLYLIPPIVALAQPRIFPIAFLFGLAAPAFASAHLYNKFFKKLEDQISAGGHKEASAGEDADEDERIFNDESRGVEVEDEESLPRRIGGSAEGSKEAPQHTAESTEGSEEA